MRQFLASAFAWNISVRSMQACASVFASCSLLPPRILYYKPWIRVYARKNVLPDPRKSQKRVSDGKLYLPDPRKWQNGRHNDNIKEKNGSQITKCISQTRHDPKCSFYNPIFCCILPKSVFYNLISYCNRSGISFHRSHHPQFLPHGPHVLPHSDHG